jgi:hypothetical protein
MLSMSQLVCREQGVIRSRDQSTQQLLKRPPPPLLLSLPLLPPLLLTECTTLQKLEILCCKQAPCVLE